jgi:membrane protein DedA with SNARE-associated domain
VIVAGVLGSLLGALIAYSLARRFGSPLLLGPGRRIGISASHLDLADRWFDRFGLPTVFFGRMLPVICTYISFPAGLAKVQPVWFGVLSLLGSTIWVTFLAVLGYEVGANYTKVAGPIGKIAIGIAVLVVIAVVAWYIRGRRKAATRSGSGA